jgi:hypothetical protein
MNMDRRTGIIVTVVTAVLFGCCGIASCFSGVATLTGGSTLSGLSGVEQTVTPAYGIPFLCLGLLFVLIPVAAWYFLVRGKEDEEGAAV